MSVCRWKCVFVAVFLWWTWNQTCRSAQLTCELLPRLKRPIYFWSLWNFIPSWNHSHLKSKARHLKDPWPLILLAGNQAVKFGSNLKPPPEHEGDIQKTGCGGCQWLQHRVTLSSSHKFWTLKSGTHSSINIKIHFAVCFCAHHVFWAPLPCLVNMSVYLPSSKMQTEQL